MAKKDYEGRILAIGDIHGNFTKFMSMYNKIEVTDRDIVIFLGDYIDRGSENKAMLEWIMEESKKENIIALRGNHEQMLLNFAYGIDEYKMWLLNGGKSTFEEIKKWREVDKGIDDKIINFMESLKLSYRMNINGRQEYFFCHAGVDPEKSLEEQTEEDLLWIREKFFTKYHKDTVIVVGHTPLMFLKSEDEIYQDWNDEDKNYEYRPSHNPINRKSIWRNEREALQFENIKPQWRCNGKVLMMDTGSFMPNGFISAIDLLSGELYQSDRL